MKKILNRRLNTISAFIESKNKVIDIGCDHGLLGIDLVINKKIDKMISSDINSGPLEMAKDNLKKYQVEDKIILKQGNGLETIEDDIDTIVISGMGGLLISDILKDLKEYPHVQKLVLSPNNEWHLLRKEIQKQGFGLQKETLVLENNKYYLISVYEKRMKKNKSYFGKLDIKDNLVKEYYQKVYNKNQEILKKLSFKKKLKKISLFKENYLIKRKFHFK